MACVVGASTGQSPDLSEDKFFTAAAGNLHRVGQQAGVQRMIVVSVTGAHENAMLSGPIPTRIVRAAQFYDPIP